VMTAAVGIIFGLPSARLKHLYLLIATLAGQKIIEYVLVQWESLTGGAAGISIIGATLFGIDLGNDRTFFYVIYACFVFLTWVAANLVRTRYGRAFIAIRDNDRAAEGMGIPLFPYKLLSFAVSSFYTPLFRCQFLLYRGGRGALCLLHHEYNTGTLRPVAVHCLYRHDHHRGPGEYPGFGIWGRFHRYP
ncbi:MAG: branched-chain amino acid ABC transporter permease, partial [Deltaproteobacteria bacterium]|nr:branched-chain amino acid ABC transporter permease [Deltaproteobacteria bacterium]